MSFLTKTFCEYLNKGATICEVACEYNNYEIIASSLCEFLKHIKYTEHLLYFYLIHYILYGQSELFDFLNMA